MDVVSLDHNYSKHHASLSSVPKCPTRYLHMERPLRQSECELESNAENDIIDVCDTEFAGVAPIKATHNTVTIDNGDVIWEESLETSSWSNEQSSLFEDVILVLKSFQLAVGAVSDKTASVKRHLALAKACIRLLRILCSNSYNRELFLWIHSLLKSSPDYSQSWFDVISNFNVKYRGLFEKMQVLSQIGPLLPKCASDRPKFPHLPYLSGIVVVIMPPRPHWFSDSRYKAFVWYLSKYFQVKSVKPSHRASHSSTGLSLRRWLRNLVIETRNVVKKVQQTSGTSVVSDVTASDSTSPKTGVNVSVPPSKSKIVLLGWGASAMVACQLAASFETEESENPLSAIVCLCPTVCSFAHGLRGHSHDPLAMEKVRVPVMFVTGQLASSANVDDIEDFRDRLPNDVKSRNIVVGGADDRLSLCSAKQLSSGLSQGDVDISVVEEIYSFLSFIVTGVPSEIGSKVDISDSQQQNKSEGTSGMKRNAGGASRGQGTRGSKASRQSTAQTASQLISSMTSVTHHRGHLPGTLLEPSAPISTSTHSQTTSAQTNSDQVEVACHDYAASSLPVSAIAIGSSPVAIPIYNSAGSEQSLRYMLSAGAVTVGEPAVKRGPPTSATPGQRCPAPIVFRKKVAAPVVVSGANLSTTIVDPSRSFIQQPSSSGTTTTVSIVNVNNPSSNVFVLSSHVKEPQL